MCLATTSRDAAASAALGIQGAEVFHAVDPEASVEFSNDDSGATLPDHVGTISFR